MLLINTGVYGHRVELFTHIKSQNNNVKKKKKKFNTWAEPVSIKKAENTYLTKLSFEHNRDQE